LAQYELFRDRELELFVWAVLEMVNQILDEEEEGQVVAFWTSYNPEDDFLFILAIRKGEEEK
jgi:hypothetical protein